MDRQMEQERKESNEQEERMDRQMEQQRKEQRDQLAQMMDLMAQSQKSGAEPGSVSNNGGSGNSKAKYLANCPIRRGRYKTTDDQDPFKRTDARVKSIGGGTTHSRQTEILSARGGKATHGDQEQSESRLGAIWDAVVKDLIGLEERAVEAEQQAERTENDLAAILVKLTAVTSNLSKLQSEPQHIKDSMAVTSHEQVIAVV
ncbi:hypothetical protein LTR95_008525 [Oleoguttula sp. CCFEE 5521]